MDEMWEYMLGCREDMEYNYCPECKCSHDDDGMEMYHVAHGIGIKAFTTCSIHPGCRVGARNGIRIRATWLSTDKFVRTGVELIDGILSDGVVNMIDGIKYLHQEWPDLVLSERMSRALIESDGMHPLDPVVDLLNPKAISADRSRIIGIIQRKTDPRVRLS